MDPVNSKSTYLQGRIKDRMKPGAGSAQKNSSLSLRRGSLQSSCLFPHQPRLTPGRHQSHTHSIQPIPLLREMHSILNAGYPLFYTHPPLFSHQGQSPGICLFCGDAPGLSSPVETTSSTLLPFRLALMMRSRVTSDQNTSSLLWWKSRAMAFSRLFRSSVYSER